jgi:glucosylglycerate synthase
MFPGSLMATANSVSNAPSTMTPERADVLVFVAPMPAQQLESLFANLTNGFRSEELLIATANDAVGTNFPAIRIVPTQATNAIWPLAAVDFVNAFHVAKENDARVILMLGPGADSLSPAAIRGLADSISESKSDLSVPHYSLPANAGLVNSAILYPLTRALFASRVRFPLSIDMALSLRMAERIAGVAQRLANTNQPDAIVWPVSEAMVAGLSIDEVDTGTRILPQPAEPNVNAILTLVTGSLFADIEAKAAFWQRPRRLLPERRPFESVPAIDGSVDIAPMVEAFRLAFTNLQEIWSLVLTPNSLLGLKRLSVVEPSAFRMPENLWARIVFDFLVAYRLRTINRGHLLGALIPLYLAWVAGHINVIGSGADSEEHVEAVASAFESEKQYIVSRWRWPDRFNP